MAAMETCHFLETLNDASLVSLGFLIWNVLGCIICKNRLCVLSYKVNTLGESKGREEAMMLGSQRASVAEGRVEGRRDG